MISRCEMLGYIFVTSIFCLFFAQQFIFFKSNLEKCFFFEKQYLEIRKCEATPGIEKTPLISRDMCCKKKGE